LAGVTYRSASVASTTLITSDGIKKFHLRLGFSALVAAFFHGDGLFAGRTFIVMRKRESALYETKKGVERTWAKEIG
jgi:hypothetical protein